MDKRKITPENLTFGDFISIDISGQEFHGEFIKSDNGLIVVKLKSGYCTPLQGNKFYFYNRKK